ncbi:TetR/AcrR family transcriptional regulator [Jiangella aurantiaca]|uniref:TetR/AcrR family transcriptional regulator n=1 Tax=Jiangella aurantiaca TaxID=2530373 RepID=A0A4R5A7R2_9ACTN|nr:TetR/AcrR family transcriptional regulator [Jiangella aurantiaca]TDD68183.1 TetR/AcrR family transcriptional regulator [Jiangella aurantiaca]
MTTSRPMRADARRNHERIVTAAREAFTEHGPGAPLDDIARRAEVGPGTLYRHFAGREALIEAVYRADVERLGERAAELAAELPPLDALTAWLREEVQYIVANRGLGAALKAAIDQDSETYALCKRLMREAAAVVLVRAQEAGQVRDDLEPRDLLLLGHGLGVAAEAAPDSFERLLSVTVSGLRPA